MHANIQEGKNQVLLQSDQLELGEAYMQCIMKNAEMNPTCKSQDHV